MTLQLRFLPEVLNDALAYRWYEAKRQGLGEEFIQLFYESSAQLVRAPASYQCVHGDVRRRILKRFPYALYDFIEDEMLVVCGLFHCARDPATVTKFLDTRI